MVGHLQHSDRSLTLTTQTDLNLDNVEFSALPSGLHLVDQDIVYELLILHSHLTNPCIQLFYEG